MYLFSNWRRTLIRMRKMNLQYPISFNPLEINEGGGKDRRNKWKSTSLVSATEIWCQGERKSSWYYSSWCSSRKQSLFNGVVSRPHPWLRSLRKSLFALFGLSWPTPTISERIAELDKFRSLVSPLRGAHVPEPGAARNSSTSVGGVGGIKNVGGV